MRQISVGRRGPDRQQPRFHIRAPIMAVGPDTAIPIGLIVTGLIVWATEYYTGTNYRPVKSIAQSSTTGHGTNVIQGLAISLEALSEELDRLGLHPADLADYLA